MRDRSEDHPSQTVYPPSAASNQGPLSSLAGVFHPVTGLVVLGLDWAMFGGSTLTFGLTLFFFSILGFLAGSAATTLVQRLFAKDSWGTSLMKGVIGGLVVGAPFPIAGTALGGFILAVCGLDAILSKPTDAIGQVLGKRQR